MGRQHVGGLRLAPHADMSAQQPATPGARRPQVSRAWLSRRSRLSARQGLPERSPPLGRAALVTSPAARRAEQSPRTLGQRLQSARRRQSRPGSSSLHPACPWPGPPPSTGRTRRRSPGLPGAPRQWTGTALGGPSLDSLSSRHDGRDEWWRLLHQRRPTPNTDPATRSLEPPTPHSGRDTARALRGGPVRDPHTGAARV